MGALVWIVAYLLVFSSQQALPDQKTVSAMAGAGILLAAGLIASALLLKILKRESLLSNDKILLMLLIFCICIFLMRGVFYIEESNMLRNMSAEFMLPLALAPLLATILLGPPGGLAVGLWTSFSTAVMDEQNFRILITGLLVTMMTVALSRRIRKRSDILRIGLVTGFTQMACVAGFSLMRRDAFDPTVVHLATSLANGMLCAILALSLLPAFEMVFDITTDVSLIELSDLGHPLLQRLAIEAPGTYHHSLVVATLSQTACEAIGANALLARVSAYFHDIGKLTKPDFFSENIQTRRDPHEHLTPTMSALLIVAHVKEGIGMAIRQRLPRLVVDAMEQHHGTGLVSYFHHKAVQLKEREKQGLKDADNHTAVVSEENFRYPGPRPVTREISVISLADAVEAASRTLTKPTPGHIEELVNDIIRRKLLDHQLDDSELTLSELKTVRRSFVITLISMFHSRVPYPVAGESPNTQPPKPNARENRGS